MLHKKCIISAKNFETNFDRLLLRSESVGYIFLRPHPCRCLRHLDPMSRRLRRLPLLIRTFWIRHCMRKTQSTQYVA